MSSYLLADDLSGALEAGVAFRERGCHVLLSLRGTRTLDPCRPGDLQVISTETRTALAGDAERRVRSILEIQKRKGIKLLYKKIDSTLRGPLGAELLPLMDVLHPQLVVFCPANPAAGRTVVCGQLLVNGIPIHQTEFRADSHWPAITSDIGRVLFRHGVHSSRLVTLAQLRQNAAQAIKECINCRTKDGTRVVIVDAVKATDLVILVDTIRMVAPSAILVGSGAMAKTLAERIIIPRARPTVDIKRAHKTLVLCGSRHPVSHQQLDHLAASAGAAVLTLNPREKIYTTAQHLVDIFRHTRIVAVRLPIILPEAHEALAAPVTYLSQIAVAVISRVNVGMLYLTGGETAWSVCRALGGQRLEIVRELECGVVVSRLILPLATRKWVITKPGGFGTDTSIVNHLSLVMK